MTGYTTKNRLVTILGLVVLLVGCTFWSRIDTQNRQATLGLYTVDLPDDWMRFEPVKDSYPSFRNGASSTVKAQRILITRDGFQLGTIDLVRLPADDAFPSIGKRISAGMLSSELAELYIANLKTTPKLGTLSVERNAPWNGPEKDGFQLQLRVKNEKGMEIDYLIYGFGTQDAFYAFSYNAPRLHYFQKYRPTFEQVMSTLRLDKSKTS
jgi:hypothetical protein